MPRSGRTLSAVAVAVVMALAPLGSASAAPIDPRVPSDVVVPQGPPKWVCRYLPALCSRT
ncbi:hypothetical protein [Mobilicoccus sp.]|uniref:hypothetical protein n=1 Tax=Mobilicoccus sp. TaxID=2034349 RepID=UPI0028B0AC9B|nr:hypothetical protein [Mobilicoccus sp.]